MATSIFQLSALSQNDSGATDGDKLYCEITQIVNGILRDDSNAIHQEIALPIPPGEAQPAPATPTWFLETESGADATFEIKIFCQTDENYPTTTITVKESDVKSWVTEPFEDRENQIYQGGANGVFGFAQKGPNGYIYTITAGVLNPKKHGNVATV